MANKIIAGDYKGGHLSLILGGLQIEQTFSPIPIKLNKRKVQNVEIITEENKKKFLGTAGGVIAGSFLLGPTGFVAGALAGGNKKLITCAVYLTNGKKFIAVINKNIYQKLLEYSF